MQILRGIATATTLTGERPLRSVAWSRAWRGLGGGGRRLLAVGAGSLLLAGVPAAGAFAAASPSPSAPEAAGGTGRVIVSTDTATGAVTVSPDQPVAFTSVAPATAEPSTRPPAAVFPEATGASRLAADGIDGTGTTVAVLDTGIDPLPDFAGRLVGGVDLSGEGDPFRDSFGHGTFVAGLIAGNGASSAGAYRGEAPGANLVSVKVSGASGATDMATVIAGINWVVENRSRLGIGVLNLSLGALPVQSTTSDPLDQAVEAAWHQGVVVVASAGNAGPFNGTILTPGDDPLVITAGALDDQGTSRTSDDTMTSFSSAGPTSMDGWFKPDLVAPGRSLVSLRAPGSTIDAAYPSARIGEANFVGSGTSFSAAVTSGAAALVLQSEGDVSPDGVKGRLLAGARPGPVGSPFVDGHGSLDAYAATTSDARLSQGSTSQSTGAGASLGSTWSVSSWNSANWSGHDSPARHGRKGAEADSSPVAPAGSAWNGSAWNSSAWNGSAWNGSAWNGSAWNVSAWNGSAWNGSAWNGSAWNGSAWNGSAWNGSAWNGSAWNGSAWNGSAWNGSAWNGSAWNGSAWNGSAWNGSAWNGSAWNGSAWN